MIRAVLCKKVSWKKLLFNGELETIFRFWGINENHIQECCWINYLEQKEVQEYCRKQWAEKELEIKSMYNTGHRVTSKWQHFRKMLWILLEDPLSSVAAKVSNDTITYNSNTEPFETQTNTVKLSNPQEKFEYPTYVIKRDNRKNCCSKFCNSLRTLKYSKLILIYFQFSWWHHLWIPQNFFDWSIDVGQMFRDIPFHTQNFKIYFSKLALRTSGNFFLSLHFASIL